MKLSAYLQDHEISPAEFAAKIGAESRMTVTRYAKGDRIPTREMMEKIFEVTGGAVRPDDFYDLPDSADAAE